MWGHWGALQPAHAAGIAWDNDISATSGAASGGQLLIRELQQLRQAGCSCQWDPTVVSFACWKRHSNLAVWALEHGAPTADNWLDDAAERGCLPVLQWARSHGRLPAEKIPELRQHALWNGHSRIVAWLDEIREVVAQVDEL
jgi:hypothetical protein